MMKKSKGISKGLRTFLGLIVIGIIICYGNIIESNLETIRKKESKEYPRMENYYREIKGRITSKSRSKGYTGTTLVVINNKSKYSISESSRNYLYGPVEFQSFIQQRDSIYKVNNSDSVFIYRNGREYYFIMGRDINKTRR